MRVIQAYRFALDPSPAQERMLVSHAGAARFAWNWALGMCQERYSAEGLWYSAAELHRLWNTAKKADPGLAWWDQNSKCVYQESFRNLERALRDFSRSRKGDRKGKRVGFPRCKKRERCRDSFRFSTGAIRCAGATVTLPRLGTIKTHEPTSKLSCRVTAGTARILSATLLTGADDQGRVLTVLGPRPLRSALRKLRRVSRAHSRKQKGSANRRKSALRLARIHAKITSIRRDALHKATSMLAARYQIVVAEDLNVAGMGRNRRLARAIADQGFGTARRMLSYKTTWRGGNLIIADRWFASSKTCSGCGHAKTKLALSERTYRCHACGLALDRDVNAARNLLNLAASGVESLNAWEGIVRPRYARHVPVNQEPGTPDGDKTGTAARQQAAAA